MALTDRMAEAYGGPRGGTTWYDDGPQFTLQNHALITLSTTALEFIVGIVPTPNSFVQGNPSPIDVLGSDNVIQACYGAQIAFNATLAVQTQVALGLQVRRGSSGAVVGGGLFAGWLYTGAGTYTGGTGTPAFTTPFVVTQMPFIVSNTALLPSPRLAATSATVQGAYMPLQPLDIITCVVVAQTGTPAVPVGTLNLTVV